MTKNNEFSPISMANCNYYWIDVKTPITREQLTDWLKALRSGSYTQGNMNLRDYQNNGLCCLGVLASVENKLSSGNFLPYADWTGSRCYLQATLSGNQSTFYLPYQLQEELGALNDNRKFSFHDIASFLEQTFGVNQ